MAGPKTRGKRKIRSARQNIQAMALPRPGDVRNAAISLSRGRLPDGSLLSKLVKAVTGAGARSRGGSFDLIRGRPQTPEQVRASIEGRYFREAAEKYRQLERRIPAPSKGRQVRDFVQGEPNILRQATAGTFEKLDDAVKDMNEARARAGERQFDYPGRRGLFPGKGNFRPEVRLDASQVTDFRGLRPNPPATRRAPTPRPAPSTRSFIPTKRPLPVTAAPRATVARSMPRPTTSRGFTMR